MSEIKLLALDLDHTLLTGKKEISEQNKLWIRRAREAGVVVTFATGRGVQTTEKYWKELELDSPLVLVNGADIWKKPGELLERHVIPGKEVRKLAEFAEQNGARFWGYSVESLTHSRDWTEELFRRDWLKIGIRHDDLATIDRLREEVRSWDLYEVTQSHPLNMEISPPGINKAYGIQRVCDYLGIGLESVMAVGDSPNDKKMLQAVGLGVAVDNAMTEIKAIADIITASNEEDGVARAIQKYVFGKKLEVS